MYLIIKLWVDEKLKWNASDYGGLHRLQVGNHEVWQPDIILFNRYKIKIIASNNRGGKILNIQIIILLVVSQYRQLNIMVIHTVIFMRMVLFIGYHRRNFSHFAILISDFGPMIRRHARLNLVCNNNLLFIILLLFKIEWINVNK